MSVVNRVFLEKIYQWNAVAEVPIQTAASIELYRGLIAEEFFELTQAALQENNYKLLDATVDLVWVLTGYARAKGYDVDQITGDAVDIKAYNLQFSEADTLTYHSSIGRILLNRSDTVDDIKTCIREICLSTLVVIDEVCENDGINAHSVLEACFLEIQRSNFTKFVYNAETGVYTCIKRDDGKILKPPHFSKADIEAVITKTFGEEL